MWSENGIIHIRKVVAFSDFTLFSVANIPFLLYIKYINPLSRQLPCPQEIGCDHIQIAMVLQFKALSFAAIIIVVHIFLPVAIQAI